LNKFELRIVAQFKKQENPKIVVIVVQTKEIFYLCPLWLLCLNLIPQGGRSGVAVSNVVS